MTPELTTVLVSLALAAVGGLVTVVKVWGENIVAELKLRQQQTLTELKANTKVTIAGKEAAEKAADQVDWQQRATAYKAALDLAERKLALVAGVPECQDCRLKIAEILAIKPVDRRRIDPPPPPEHRPLL